MSGPPCGSVVVYRRALGAAWVCVVDAGGRPVRGGGWGGRAGPCAFLLVVVVVFVPRSVFVKFCPVVSGWG